MDAIKNLHRTPASTAEQVVCARRCRVFNISPELTTTGTITLRNQATAAGGSSAIMHVCAIGLTQVGKDLGGALFDTGLTVQLSAATDLTGITWSPV